MSSAASGTVPTVIRHLDQVAVGIAEVNGHHRAQRTRLLDGALRDHDAVRLEMPDDLFERRLGDEAKVHRSGRGLERLGLELASRLVQVDLLAAECQAAPAARE